MKSFIAQFTLITFLSVQILSVTAIALMPKPAEAFVVKAFTTEVANFYDIAKDIGKAALRAVAIKFINQFLMRFAEKIIDKYRVRNFLYYDQILTDYYLTNYIQDKIADPDLRRVFTLMNAAYVTGQPTGYTGQPPSNQALIPQLKQAIYKWYLDSGGTPEEFFNSPMSYSSIDYHDAAYSYYMNPPSFTENALRGQMGYMQSSATTAAQLEVAVGKGLKAGRVVGTGTCSISNPSVIVGAPTPPQQTGNLPSNPLPANNPFQDRASCERSGGTWTASTVDQARAFIDNPTEYVSGWMNSALDTILKQTYDSNNWAQAVGSALGSFIFNRLFLTSTKGITLYEDPRLYAPDSGTVNFGTPIDLDSDGITDGYDINGDGQADVCLYGGVDGPVGPPCKGSKEATTAPTIGADPGTGGCTPPAFANPVPPGSNSLQADIQGSLSDAIAADPTNANVANSDPRLNDAANAIMSATVDNLLGRGLKAGFAQNCNGNQSSDSIVAFRSGDAYAEYADLFVGFGANDSRTLADMASATVSYNTDLPRSCIRTSNPGSC